MRLARAGILAALAALAAACDTARTVEETAQTKNDCARCHGYPPPPFIAGGTSHPTSTQCHLCHQETVAADDVTIIPGGLHMNGVVDVTGAHPLPYLAQHTAGALANITSCQACHGPDYGGGQVGVSCNACHAAQVAASAPDWKTNCTFCHGTRTANWTEANLPLAAPPQGVSGETAVAAPEVGAHQAHLAGTTLVNPLPCASCHVVPPRTFPGSLDHVTGGDARITFSALATKGVTNADYASAGGSCAVYCHGAGTQFVNPGAAAATTASPAWTASIGTLSCTACHGAPPSTGRHTSDHANQPCGRCHATVAGTGATPSITNRANHVNGQKDVTFSVSGTFDDTAKTCTNVACHGVNDTRSWYP